MKQATARQPHGYENSKVEKYAFYRRRDHGNIEAMQNLIIAAIAAESGFELKPNSRHLISAIQGAHGGGEVVNVEFERNYLTLAAQLQFTGTEEAQRARVRDWLDALEFWQINTYLLFTIKKGGKIIGYRDDDSPICTVTTFIDHLLPVADEAVMRARDSVQWTGNTEQKIKAHPGIALAAQVEWAVKQLSRHPRYQAPDPPPKGSKPLSISEYVAQRQDIMLAENKRILGKLKDSEPTDVDEIDARLATLEVFYARARKDIDLGYESARTALLSMRDSRCKRMMDFTDPEEIARDVDAKIAAGIRSGATPPPTEIDHAGAHFAGTEGATTQEGDTSTQNATSYTCDFSAPDGYVEVEIDEGGGGNFPTQSTEEMPAKTQDSEPNMLGWALLWASRGIPVFPLHEVYDDVCTCTCADHWRKKEGKWTKICEGDNHVCGSECGNKGKHPRTDRKIGLQNGLKIASTDPDKITVWWSKYPTANIGGRMLGKVGIDVDGRHGGNATLYDLCEKHGQEWLEGAWENKSGSGGPHFIFDNPPDISFKNSAGKIGPGIDTRGDDGYLVMPPSLHVSGQRYEVESPAEFFPPLPQFMIDLLNKPKGEGEVVYQDSPKNLSAVGFGEKFPDGRRNDGLLAYGIGRVRHAWERTEDEIYQQLSQVNQVRCVPPLDDEEVRSLAAHIAYDYAYLYGVNATEKEVAA